MFLRPYYSLLIIITTYDYYYLRTKARKTGLSITRDEAINSNEPLRVE